MKRSILLLLIAVIMTVVGCNKDIGAYMSKSYVQYLVDADTVWFSNRHVYGDVETIWISLFDKNYYSLIMPEEREIYNKRYDSLMKRYIEKYNDNGYNRKLLPFSKGAIANEFTSIDVVSDSDFNSFSAGESLKSIVKLIGASPREYILSRYKK